MTIQQIYAPLVNLFKIKPNTTQEALKRQVEQMRAESIEIIRGSKENFGMYWSSVEGMWKNR